MYPEHVRKHELTHRAVRDYTCATCHMKFRTQAALSSHVSAGHKPPNSYQCLSCPLYYLNKEELLTHLKKSNHPKGVYSTQSFSTVPPATRRKVVKTPALETPEAVGVFDDVVLYLEDGAVFVDQVVQPQDEVQTAISSIVEVTQTEAMVEAEVMVEPSK